MSRAMTCHDHAPILDPSPEIVAAVRAYRAAPPEDPWYELNGLEAVLPVGAWYPVDGRLWGWAKRTSYFGLTVVDEPTCSPWPRRD